MWISSLNVFSLRRKSVHVSFHLFFFMGVHFLTQSTLSVKWSKRAAFLQVTALWHYEDVRTRSGSFLFRLAGIFKPWAPARLLLLSGNQLRTHTSHAPASSSAHGTADCTSIHPRPRKTFGTSHRCFSSWFVTDSVVSQQSAWAHTRTHTHVHTHTDDEREDVKRVSCKKEDPLLVSSFSLLVVVCSWYDPV